MRRGFQIFSPTYTGDAEGRRVNKRKFDFQFPEIKLTKRACLQASIPWLAIGIVNFQDFL
ncbi:MAG: hypothetical protein CVU00_07795 [Bacteroidetes bacterium HGW-Bacteroidetes-17]|nr:MAG: hypothetical protein CVU00_07795 [Bacteroidetes bacterium HGW-Bacteroidetes-17]